jgi:F-type H+-transporting ATPase subunit delta
MTTHINSLARIYARSLFELAAQAGGQEKIVEVGQELEQIVDLARADRRFGEYLRSPIIERSARQASISRLFSDKVTDLTLRFLLVLNGKRRLSQLEGIASAFDQMVHESFGRVEVDLFTPTPISPEQLAHVREQVHHALGREPVMYAYTDPSMIGGIKLRVGDQLIDGSVATRLRRLRERLMAGGGTALRQRMSRLIDEATGDREPGR